ncbi:MAG: NFACT RNA binding domain-containing protein [Sulfurovum sp.]|nr:NFACT RNA binding domain-containing protein [Sulfurovum sp.]MCB4745036.1 NFACT RNA binding domain-containing protein [Sulfurovum sp.]MCB4746673.1 NFACT RNA binding domain-containing protein [Sulfurovum sp.]MCB4748823.1 NFACT RNA binding domain-containing protein [Sulfurovum sp.]MCB4749916.1 NFACT RNA binding domain-containing protein [Sulfurovum sp.]
MKLKELQAISKRLNNFTYLSRARRIEDNIIELIFNKDQSYFFNMTRGHSFVYKASSQRPLQGYNAPFDTLLHSLLAASRLLEVSVPENDRILRIKIAPKSTYKDKAVTLQLEFTGKNTNAILLDENEVIIEALRHIDSESSFRVVRPGIELLPIPPRGESKKQEIDSREQTIDIDFILEERYKVIQAKRLEEMKQQKISSVTKKIIRLQQELDRLSNEALLEIEVQKNIELGNLILANLYQIKPYDTKLKTNDFEGNEIIIKLPKNVTVNRYSDHFFNLAKRAKSKAKNIHIERENLESKKHFYENILCAIKQAKSPYALELLVPKRGKSQRKKEKLREGELFWIEDYKVMVGRNSKENQVLLKMAKGNDIWMHTREIPGSHVIIRTDKQNLPDSVLNAAAKLCVDFSTNQPGNYLVDHTKRKFVKIQEGSSVEYDKYQTIPILKEGVEIRV